MIYFASDDSFFALGAEAVFNSANKDVLLIYLDITKEAPGKIFFTSEDILLIAIEQTDIIIDLMITARRHGTKVWWVLDNVSDRETTSIQSVLSKKMPLDALFPLLEANATHLQDLLFLTRQEEKKMRALTTGKTLYSLAKEFNLSIKTICSHKVNALKKLGLNHLNARSVLIFGKICRGLSAF